MITITQEQPEHETTATIEIPGAVNTAATVRIWRPTDEVVDQPTTLVVLTDADDRPMTAATARQLAEALLAAADQAAR